MAGYSIIQECDPENDENRFMPVVVGGARQSSKSMISWMAVALLVSLSFNVYNVMHYFQPPCSIDQVPSIYAGLYRNVPTEILKHTAYDSPNRAIENAAWDNPDLLPEHGFIALDDSWAAAKGLPATQRWPWDNTKACPPRIGQSSTRRPSAVVAPFAHLTLLEHLARKRYVQRR